MVKNNILSKEEEKGKQTRCELPPFESDLRQMTARGFLGTGRFTVFF